MLKPALKCSWATQTMLITADTHAEALKELATLSVQPLIAEEGFADEQYHFFDRFQAVKVAKKLKLVPADFVGVELYDEDLIG